MCKAVRSLRENKAFSEEAELLSMFDQLLSGTMATLSSVQSGVRETIMGLRQGRHPTEGQIHSLWEEAGLKKVIMLCIAQSKAVVDMVTVLEA